ncbi:hypothetical protein JTE90_007222 [Oedothorax gibbosus]|uniref:Uncharacterized protein n=1 Tax=Oedothorax gibbosus TaxID=931172 RepID=A0AAV6VN62_9ARAC|nr:hypothetical protein JTE90_007222 [Oedothorax gibbosus]
MAAGEYVKKQFKQLIPQFMLNHPTCFYQTLMITLSGAAEQLWEEVGFKCPSSLNGLSHKHYALVNFLGPVVSLWMICLLASNMAKRLCQGQGCDCSDKECCSTFKSVFCQCQGCSTFCSTFKSVFCQCQGCSTFWSVFFRTLVIPLAWVFVSLMDGDVFACYNHRPNCTIDSNTIFIDGINCTTDVTRWDEANKTESKFYGWCFAGISLFLVFLGVTTSRCCSERPYFPNFYSNILKKWEQVEMEKFLEEGAKVTAADNAGAITKAVNNVTPKDWEAICMLHQKKTVEQSGNAKKKEYYSPLSEWVANNHPNPNSAPSTEAPLQDSVSASENHQESAQTPKQKPSVVSDQVLTPNSDSASSTEALPLDSASASQKGQGSAQAQNQNETKF